MIFLDCGGCMECGVATPPNMLCVYIEMGIIILIIITLILLYFKFIITGRKINDT